ncbi:MAG TPA: hypothetical protein PK765_05230 [bacterium]|nr:hypothetical protein [bacterium]
MQTTARKLAAASATVALLASLVSPVALAANITDIQVNGGTTLTASQTITTIAFSVPTNVASVVVTYPSTVDDTGFVNGDVAVGGVIDTPSNIAVSTSNNTITFDSDGSTSAGVATITLSNAHFVAPASGLISFSVSAGADQGAAIIAVAGSNQVVVSATIVPTLSMAINTTNANLGTLSPSAPTVSTGGSDITVATNAANGYTLSAAGLSSDATNMPLDASTDLTNGVAGFGIYVSGATDSATIDEGFDNDSTSDLALTGSAQAIASKNAPTASSVVTVKYKGSAAAITPAGNYTLTTTYTISGSF